MQFSRTPILNFKLALCRYDVVQPDENVRFSGTATTIPMREGNIARQVRARHTPGRFHRITGSGQMGAGALGPDDFTESRTTWSKAGDDISYK